MTYSKMRNMVNTLNSRSIESDNKDHNRHDNDEQRTSKVLFFFAFPAAFYSGKHQNSAENRQNKNAQWIVMNFTADGCLYPIGDGNIHRANS